MSTYYLIMELKVIRRVTRYRTAYHLNLSLIWVKNRHIQKKQPFLIIMKSNGNLEIMKLGGVGHE